MPQIQPITIGAKTYGSPRTVKGGNSVLFLNKDAANGAIGDQRLYVSEEPFSSTRPNRKASLRIEHAKVGTNVTTGAVSVQDRASVELILTHGASYSEAELTELRNEIVAAIADGTYGFAVTVQRDGQY